MDDIYTWMKTFLGSDYVLRIRRGPAADTFFVVFGWLYFCQCALRIRSGPAADLFFVVFGWHFFSSIRIADPPRIRLLSCLNGGSENVLIISSFKNYKKVQFLLIRNCTMPSTFSIFFTPFYAIIFPLFLSTYFVILQPLGYGRFACCLHLQFTGSEEIIWNFSRFELTTSGSIVNMSSTVLNRIHKNSTSNVLLIFPCSVTIGSKNIC
jgi:hypothetical protein